MKIVSAVSAPAVMPLMNSRIAAALRINRTLLSFWPKKPEVGRRLRATADRFQPPLQASGSQTPVWEPTSIANAPRHSHEQLKIFFAKQWRVYRISAHCFGSACNLNHLLI